MMAYDPLMVAFEAVAEIMSSLDEVTLHFENTLSESLSANEYGCTIGESVLPKSRVFSLADMVDNFVFKDWYAVTLLCRLVTLLCMLVTGALS